jgi:hypothetical protein
MSIEKRYLNQKEAEVYTGMGKVNLADLMHGHVIRLANTNGTVTCTRRYYDKHIIDERMKTKERFE